MMRSAEKAKLKEKQEEKVAEFMMEYLKKFDNEKNTEKAPEFKKTYTLSGCELYGLVMISGGYLVKDDISISDKLLTDMAPLISCIASKTMKTAEAWQNYKNKSQYQEKED